MFKPPVQLEEWVALNAAVVDATDDNAQTADGQALSENAVDSFLPSGSPVDDGDKERNPERDDAAMSAFGGISPLAYFNDVIVDGQQGQIIGAAMSYINGAWTSYYENLYPHLSRPEILDLICDDMVANGNLFCDNPDVMNGLSFDATHDGTAVTVRFYYDSSVWSSVPLGQYNVTWTYHPSSSGEVKQHFFAVNLVPEPIPPPPPPPPPEAELGDPIVVEPPMDPTEPTDPTGPVDPTPGIVIDSPTIQIQNENTSAFHTESYDSFEWGHDRVEWTTPGMERSFSLELESLPEAESAETEELLLALNQVQRQAGNLEQAIAGLQDKAVDHISALDDAAAESVSEALNQGSSLLDTLSREVGLLSSMAKQYADTGPELRDGIMLEGIVDGSERAVDAGHLADAMTSGLSSMAEALAAEGGAAVKSAFVTAMETALTEAKAAAARQDGAQAEIDLYNARQGVTDRSF